MRQVLLLGGLFLIAPVQSCAQDRPTQPSYMGLTLPYPRKQPESFTGTPAPWVRRVVRATVRVTIDSSGVVTEVRPDGNVDSLLIQKIRYLIDELPFYPAILEGRAVASQIPVELIFRPDARTPIFVFPNGYFLGRKDHRLTREACRLNGIELPQIEKYPIYAGANDDGDSVLYPRAVIQVDLDTAGQVIGSDILCSSFPDIDGPLLSTALWTDFSPAILSGTGTKGTVFLQLSLFPAMDYPLPPWMPESWDSMSFHRRASVRLVADTAGLLFPPVPRTDAGDYFSLRTIGPSVPDTLDCYAVVDTMGRVMLRPEWRAGKATSELVKTLQRRIRLYPALDLAGRRQTFRGFITIIVESATNVRIQPHWLRRPH